VRILEAKNDRPAAQALRWSTFEKTLHAGTLRDYIAKLDEFQEFDEVDRALTIAGAFAQPYVALAFFMEGPRLDRAAKLVLDKRQLSDGRHYGVLVETAAYLVGVQKSHASKYGFWSLVEGARKKRQ
jgi:hypothetical protein